MTPAQAAELQDAMAEEQGMVPIGIPENRAFGRLARSRKSGGARVYEPLPDGGYRVLHPTKGWRTFTKKRLDRIAAVDTMRRGWAAVAASIAKTLPRQPSKVGAYAPYGHYAHTAQIIKRETPPATVTRQQRRFAARKGIELG